MDDVKENMLYNAGLMDCTKVIGFAGIFSDRERKQKKFMFSAGETPLARMHAAGYGRTKR